MSYNISNIKTLYSTLKINKKSVRKILRKYIDELPENCFLFDLANLENEEIQLENILWADSCSGTSFDLLKKILKKYTIGEGDFCVIWEDGDISGLSITGEGENRKITEPSLFNK